MECVEQDILAVMTDRLHKSGFKMHATLLKHMFQLVEGGHVTIELYDVAQHPNITVIRIEKQNHTFLFFIFQEKKNLFFLLGDCFALSS